jgi:hypothetical protein
MTVMPTSVRGTATIMSGGCVPPVHELIWELLKVLRAQL